MKNTLTFMFQDNKFYKKVSVFLLFQLSIILIVVSQLMNNYIQPVVLKIVLALIFCFLNTVIFGYQIAVIRTIKDSENCSVIPEINLLTNFKLGIKYIISALLILIPFYYVIASLGILTEYGWFIALTDIPGCFEYIIPICTSLLILSVIITVLFQTFMMPALISIYASDNKCLSFYNFDNLKTIFKSNPKHYLLSCIGIVALYLVIDVLYYLIGVLISKSLILYLIPAVLVTVIVSTYVFYIISYTIAKINTFIE